MRQRRQVVPPARLPPPPLRATHLTRALQQLLQQLQLPWQWARRWQQLRGRQLLPQTVQALPAAAEPAAAEAGRRARRTNPSCRAQAGAAATCHAALICHAAYSYAINGNEKTQLPPCICYRPVPACCRGHRALPPLQQPRHKVLLLQQLQHQAAEILLQSKPDWEAAA